MLQMAEPRPKVNPPHSEWISFVYTRVASPCSNLHDGNSNSGFSSAMSISFHPCMSCAALPRFTTSTYSSDSVL